MKLSKNFTLDELTFSSTAAQSGIHNEPSGLQIEALQELVTNVLQPLRDYFNVPISILSGFRSAALNRAVGGAYNSQHLYGEAADIRILGIGNDLIWQYIRDNLSFDQVILEHVPAAKPTLGWVHVSYKANGANRKDAISCPSGRNYVKGMVYAN